jgi:transcriptional regulator with XRE-family HTH domain
VRTKSNAKRTGEAIKAARQRCEYTPKKLAELTNIAPATITAIEAGKIEPTLEMIRELADALRTTPDNLIAFRDEPIGIRTSLTDVEDRKILACYLNGWELDTVDYRKSGNVLLEFRKKEQ